MGSAAKAHAARPARAQLVCCRFDVRALFGDESALEVDVCPDLVSRTEQRADNFGVSIGERLSPIFRDEPGAFHFAERRDHCKVFAMSWPSIPLLDVERQRHMEHARRLYYARCDFMGKNSDERDPFARMEQTHRRLEERLEMLARAAEDLRAGIGVSSAIADLEEVAHYLGRGAVRHVEDEENTLFPRLREHVSAGAKEELELIMRALESEHAEHRALENSVRSLIGGWENKKPVPEEVSELQKFAGKLRAVYATHIAREEKELFPLARKILSPEEVERMGEEMMARRPDRGTR
jgi:hemerythrin-like domain-containing protein